MRVLEYNAEQILKGSDYKGAILSHKTEMVVEERKIFEFEELAGGERTAEHLDGGVSLEEEGLLD